MPLLIVDVSDSVEVDEVLGEVETDKVTNGYNYMHSCLCPSVVCVCLSVCLSVCVSVCVCVCVCVCVHMCVRMCEQLLISNQYTITYWLPEESYLIKCFTCAYSMDSYIT